MIDAHQPGDTVLVEIEGAVGKAIEFGQWLNGDGFSVFEHAAMYLGGGVVVEAEPGGARRARLSEYDGRAQYWSTGRIVLTDKQRLDVCAAARKYADARVPYSFLDYDALAVHRMHIPVPGLKRYIGNTGHMICSQLVDQCYMDAGVHLFSDGRWPGYVTPGHLYQLFRRIG